MDFPFDSEKILKDPPFYIDPKTNTSSTILIGQSRAGKSVLIDYLFKRFFKNHITILFTPNYQSHVYDRIRNNPNTIISPFFIPHIIGMMNEINQETNNKYKFLVILDDIVDARYKLQLEQLVLSLRNSNISSIIGIQWPPLIKPNVRNNANNVCFFMFHNPEGRKRILTDFLYGMFGELSMQLQMRLYKSLTNDHHFIFNNNYSGENYICKIDYKDPEKIGDEKIEAQKIPKI
jgi:hypothetical protein